MKTTWYPAGLRNPLLVFVSVLSTRYSQLRTRLAGFLDLEDFAVLVVAAFGASVVRQLALVAVRTFGERLRRQMIVCATLRGARLGMAPLRIWHIKSSLKLRPNTAGADKFCRNS